MASRILSMGDMLTLIEKEASQVYDEQKAPLKWLKRCVKETPSISMISSVVDQVTKYGANGRFGTKMIPGMANNPAVQNMKVDEKQIARKRAIVSSMTPKRT